MAAAILVSESQPEVLHNRLFTKLKDAATIFFVDGQWAQSAEMVQNKNKAQVYFAENKKTVFYRCPNLGL